MLDCWFVANSLPTCATADTATPSHPVPILYHRMKPKIKIKIISIRDKKYRRYVGMTGILVEKTCYAPNMYSYMVRFNGIGDVDFFDEEVEVVPLIESTLSI